MKKQLILVVVLLCAALAPFVFRSTTAESVRTNPAGRQSISELRPRVVRAAAVGISPKVSGLPPAQPDRSQTNKKTADEKARAVPNNLPFRKQVAGAQHDADAGFAQMSAVPMPSSSLSFEGISSSDNAAAYGFRILPPDTFGDVGLAHYVQAVNALVRIFDKQGNALTPPLKMSSIFAPLGTPCSSRNDGDPVALYDALADRWILSQFCTQFPPFRQMIAVSRTGDPTGDYYIYEFVMPNVKLNDYPKLGVWPDAYYMSTDQFLGSDYAGTGAFAFDRARMLTGDPAASYVYFDLAAPSTIRLGGLLPADHDGLNAPPAGAPNLFVGYTATEYGEAADAIRLFEFRVDFSRPASSTFTERPESPLAVAAFDPTSPDGRADIAQPTPGERLDSQSDRLMYRVGYRNFGAFDSIVFNQTVRVTPLDQVYRAGVRMYELRRELLSGGPAAPFTVLEAATIGENSTSRWMASAAQDHQGNIAVGYSVSNEEKQPSIVYAGRLAADPAGVYRGEQPLIHGTGVQTAFGFRWGDYTALSVDPSDDCTFWLTNQYYTLESQEESPFGWLTRIGRFRFAECTDAPRAGLRGTVTNAANSSPINGAAVTANSVYSRTTGAAGTYGDFALLPGMYALTAAARGFRPQSVNVAITDGQMLTQNFALQPTAVIDNEGTSLIEESCARDNRVEPSEVVTILIPLRNTGAAATSNLTARLEPAGGVLNPSAPQNYGQLPPGGAGVTRAFSFRASPNLACGDEMTLTLVLEDGAESLGTLAIGLKTGTPRIALQESFDSVAAPQLPAGWATSATGAQQNWSAATSRRETPPNSVFSPAPHQVGLNELVSPVFQITSPAAELEFRNWYELETTFLRNRLYDGSVLEIRIGDGDWQDIEAAGGVFLAGGYDGVIDSCCQNPLAGRRGWSGRSGVNQTSEFITSKVKLPASAAGRSVRLRWRVGTDIGTFRTGQFIDDLIVTDGFVCSCLITQKSRAPFDFDGDGRTDLSVFRPNDNPSEADFYVRSSADSSTSAASWGSVGDHAANADFDGDGRADLAVFRPSTGTWFVLNSADSSILTANFGLPGDRIAPADYDGDGRVDLAIYRPSTAIWYVLQSSGGEVRTERFGLAEDLPVPADFDGDNRADVAVFRPGEGNWYVARSSDGGVGIVRFGLAGDRPVPGDFDGDGRADFVVFRPSSRIWYLLRTAQGFSAVQFGLESDQPLQADFDGDGRRDVALFRPATGVWYFLRSSDGGLGTAQFGLNGDTAVPSIFVR